jgi:hypothetical protein
MMGVMYLIKNENKKPLFLTVLLFALLVLFSGNREEVSEPTYLPCLITASHLPDPGPDALTGLIQVHHVFSTVHFLKARPFKSLKGILLLNIAERFAIWKKNINHWSNDFNGVDIHKVQTIKKDAQHLLRPSYYLFLFRLSPF